MRFSLNWLQEIFNTALSSKVLEDELTRLGLEVDAIEVLEPSFMGLKVAEVLEVKPHPDADRLVVAKVFDGTQELQVVCGANNCKKGLITALAPIDSHFIDKEGKTHKIKKGKLRGVDSHGMLASAEEMGLEDKSEGIVELPSDLQVGEELTPYFQDDVLDISFTPNLGHAMSVLGIARELSCLLKKPFTFKKFPLNEMSSSIEKKVTLKVSDKKKCPHYACRLIENIEISPSPFWLQQKLKACGIKSINNVVDATNYVLHEMGHPLHAFDFDALDKGHIKVQSFSKEISFETLDGVKRQVPPDTLFICDASKPIAIAGVMGGANSQVHDKTQTILLEAAVFSPQAIRKTSRLLNLATDASKHFERGVDAEALTLVLDRAAGLIQEIAGGQVAKGLLNFSVTPYKPRIFSCRPDFINQLLGTTISTDEMVEILGRLDFKPTLTSKKLIQVSVPSYRNDVNEEIDLVKDVARFYGFDQIIHEKPSTTFTHLPDTALYTFEAKAHKALLQEGLQEILTCDLISPEMSTIQQSKDLFLSALNTVSIDQSILRSSLLANHLQVLKQNQGYQNTDLQMYEIGKTYSKKGECFNEETQLAVTLTGHKNPFHFETQNDKVDFFYLKGILENVLDHLSIKGLSFKRSKHSFFHPGIQADLIYQDRTLGFAGEIHPSVLRGQDLKHSILFAQLSLPSLMALSDPLEQIQPLPSYPSSERDWTLTCLDDLEVGHLLSFIKSLESRLLKKIFLLDLYRSEAIGTDRKNVTLRFVYRNDKKTISFEATEVEHAKIMTQVLKEMKNLIIQPI